MADLGVIFDIDGVLVASYQPHFESWRAITRELGSEMTEAQFVETFGWTSREIIRHFWPQLASSPAEVARIDQRKEALYRELIRAHFPPMDGAVELIDALAADGFRLAVGSSGPRENVELTVEKLGRRGKFQAAISGSDVTRGKPDPQIFQLAAQRLNLPPEHCLVIEDAPAGVAAAKAAGAKCLGLAGGPPRDLSAADLVVHSLREVDSGLVKRLLS
jgi:beta-phosphoglucomutase